MLPAFAYVRPTSLKDVAGHFEKGTARLHSGGTDLVSCLRDGILDTQTVVSLARIPGLSGIDATPDGGLRIGAMTRIADIAAHPEVAARFTALAQGAGSVGSPQLRNQGTLGGNLCQKPRCWYYRGEFHCIRKGGDICYAYEGQNEGHAIFGGELCYYVHPSDTAPALAALGAVVKIEGPGGARLLPIEELFVLPSKDPERETVVEPGEVVVSIALPAPPAGLRSSYRKVRARAAWDFALVGMAVALVQSGSKVSYARIVLSGVAAAPWRVPAVEKALVGSPLDAATIRRAANAAVEGAEPLEHNAYKVGMLRGLVESQLEAFAS